MELNSEVPNLEIFELLILDSNPTGPYNQPSVYLPFDLGTVTKSNSVTMYSKSTQFIK